MASRVISMTATAPITGDRLHLGIGTALRNSRILDVAPCVQPAILEAVDQVASQLEIIRFSGELRDSANTAFKSPGTLVFIDDCSIRRFDKHPTTRHLVMHVRGAQCLEHLNTIGTTYPLTLFYAPDNSSFMSRRYVKPLVARQGNTIVVSHIPARWPAEHKPTWLGLKDAVDDFITTPHPLGPPGNIRFLMADEYRAYVGDDKYRNHGPNEYRLQEGWEARWDLLPDAW